MSFKSRLALVLAFAVLAFSVTSFAATKKAKPADAAKITAETKPTTEAFPAPEEANGEELIPAAKLVVGSAPNQAATSGSSAVAAEAATAPILVGEPAAATASKETEVAAPSKEEVAKLPEAQIPVLTGAKQQKRAESGGLTRILITLGVLTVLSGAAFFGLKRWAKNRGPKGPNPKIRVLTQHALGPKKNLAIVQVAGESILIGVTDHNITMLKTLALIDDEVPEAVPNHFGNSLSDFIESEDDRALDARSMRQLPAAEHDDFAMRGLTEIRDKVTSRLKSIKQVY